MASQAKIRRVRNMEIVLSHDDGTPDTSHAVYIGASITLNARPASLKDLLPGDSVVLGGDPVVMIHAHRDQPPVEQKPDASKLTDDELLAECSKRGLRLPSSATPAPPILDASGNPIVHQAVSPPAAPRPSVAPPAAPRPTVAPIQPVRPPAKS